MHIHKHYHAPLRMEELAEIAFLSISGLHRLFQRHTQMSVSEYVIALRIGESCSRLSGTNQPIQHIAAEVGYASSPISTGSSDGCAACPRANTECPSAGRFDVRQRLTHLPLGSGLLWKTHNQRSLIRKTSDWG